MTKYYQFCLLLSASSFLYDCNAQPVDDFKPEQQDAFEKLTEQFSIDYTDLHLPEFNISFITNLKNLGSKKALNLPKLLI